jgi:hypothetical protein
MTKQQLIRSSYIILFLSLCGITLWLFEIVGIKGWYGLGWLSQGQLYTPFIATLLVVISFLIPFILSRKTTLVKVSFSIVILYAVSIISFLTGEQLLHGIYCKLCFWTTGDMVMIYVKAFVIFTFTGIAYGFVTNRFIKKNKSINKIMIIGMLLMVIPLSLATVTLFPGFGRGIGWVDAVKMGYPVFWTTFLLGVSGIILARQPD